MSLELFWSRFTYRTTYLFLFGVWNVLESVPYVFLSVSASSATPSWFWSIDDKVG